MRSTTDWTESPPERDNVRTVVYSVAFSPDGTRIVAGAGPRVFIYDLDGNPVQSLKGHTDAVYCVAYSSDNSRFASGGADNTVIIWSSEGKGLLKFTHKATIQALAYNPVTQQLASASEVDFGLWNQELRSVPKHQTRSRVFSLAWTHDGSYLALGHADGTVSLRDKSGEQLQAIEVTHGAGPVWNLTFSPTVPEGHPTLAVSGWHGQLAFYEILGRQLSASSTRKPIELGFKPTSLCYSASGDFVLVGGTTNKLQLYTKEGVFINTVTTKAAWIWSVSVKPNKNAAVWQVAVGCEDGSISLETITFNTVHGLYKDCYAHRDLMTDVVIRPLGTPHRLRIKCRDYVKKISVYENVVAAQLSTFIVVYERVRGDGAAIQYKIRARMPYTNKCDLLVVTSQHITMCQKRKLQTFNFKGVQVREWVMDSNIKYVKCLGGPPGAEGILASCRDGRVVTIYINNPFPIQLWQHHTGVRCVDVSCSKSTLALIDDNTQLKVINLSTGTTRFEDEKVSSAAFNRDHEDMIAYSGVGMLSIRTGAFKPYRQRMSSLVVSFQGAKVYCLSNVQMVDEDVPLSSTVQQYVEGRAWASAYEVACLGVTQEDWASLGHAALLDLDIGVARKAFMRMQDLLMLNLVHRLDVLLKAGTSTDVLRGEVLAYQGKYEDASSMFAKAGATERIMQLWTDLRQFDKATKWAERAGNSPAMVDALRTQQAQWSEEVRDYKAAATMYLDSGKSEKAMQLLTRHSLDWAYLLEVARRLDRAKDARALQIAISALLKHDETAGAKELMMKVEDWPALVKMHVKEGAWSTAFMTAKRCPAEEPELYETYAQWLVHEDRYDEARQAFARAGKPQMASQILEELCYCSVTQRCFKDAGYYFFQVALEALQSVKRKPHEMKAVDRRALDRFADMYSRAELYYAFDFVHRAVNTPFQTEAPRVLFNAARFLFMRLVTSKTPLGVSLATVVYLMASNAEAVGAWKLARAAYQKLQSLKVPAAWQTRVDAATLSIRAKPRKDSDDVSQTCFRCTAAQPLLNTMGDVCPSCGAQVFRSFATFEALPIVEFDIAPDITDTEAAQLLAMDPLRKAAPPAPPANAEKPLGGVLGREEGADFLRLDDADIEEAMPIMDAGDGDTDPFVSQMSIPHTPITADRSMLRNMTMAEVLVRRFPNDNIPAQYFRVMDPLADLLVGPCGHFFEADDYEMMSLQEGCRPFSQEKLELDGL